MLLKDYIEWYKQHYGKTPGANLIEAFERMNIKELNDLKEEIDKTCEEFDFLK